MNENRIDELIEKVLRDEQTLPEGLAQRLEANIDRWTATEEKAKVIPLHKRLWYGISAAAAIVLLCVGLFFIQTSPTKTVFADTYTNPEEAAVAAEKALLLLSQNLNKGLKQVNDAQAEMDKVNHILNKHLNN